MILWHFPALGGKEYLLHHGLSMYSIFLSLISGNGQFYILMVLFTESTTPFVNLRWYLDLARKKNSKLYILNGIALFLGWLVTLFVIFLFIFLFVVCHFFVYFLICNFKIKWNVNVTLFTWSFKTEMNVKTQRDQKHEINIMQLYIACSLGSVLCISALKYT
ncbi:hypothetical protein QJS04_geneDACA021711 [Acorus gramineus]|uniref:TLC domain-containing protein n=1 Tax=Acorus gramineus TaxID=55184 RepID=A0AAV9AGE5_ACOGR|nr:hypothetical protein QJS04_geneDACA021711 [Acorus gramineus]